MTSRTPPTDPSADETRLHEPVNETETAHLERVEERLVADVRAEQAGSVRIEKRVVEEPETLEVTLRHDEVDLERRKVDRPLAAGEQPVTVRGEETVVLVVEERLEVRKVPWVVEEIHLRRRLTSETRRIEDTVRKERFEVRTEGDVNLEQR
jgi:uncharacterized protein (TIGR02271 family)